MPLSAGSRIGEYEIVEAIGAGGMGEVYRARDTKLGRDVALKILPQAFAADADRLARFRREAQVLASLNHPGIAQIYGFEDAGTTQALALELVPGPTLAELVRRSASKSRGGGLSLPEAVRITAQIAGALEAAHEAGVVHRDLKPANIKVRDDGAVKVLDFGLAKVKDAEDTASMATMTSPAMTSMGVILGTASYMSPEQAKGRPVDKRADIWAFGVVLFEMLTGAPLFKGDSVVETISLVATRDPEWTRLPADTPPAIKQLLRRCLDRDPHRRLRDIGEARIVLTSPIVPADAAPAAPRSRRTIAFAAAALATAAATGLIVWGLKPAAEVPLRQYELPEELANATTALSPNGTKLAVMSAGRLIIRPLDAAEAREVGALPAGSSGLYWSPDSRTIAFAAEGALKVVSIEGGPIREVCKLPTNTVMGVGWRQDGTIVLAAWHDGLFSVPATGGVAARFVAIDPSKEVDFHEVSAMPDDRLVVTTHLLGDTATRRVELVGAGLGGARQVIVSDPSYSHAEYSPTGHLLLGRVGINEGIWAVPFRGGPVDLTRARLIAPSGRVFSRADDGTLLYSKPNTSADLELVWVTPSGATTSVPGSLLRSNDPCCPELSPDGKRAALVTTTSGVRNLVVRNLASGVDTRLTFQQSDEDRIGTRLQNPATSPAWFPSGDRVLYVAGTVGSERLVVRPSDGTGAPRVLVRADSSRVSHDGRYLIFTIDEAGQGRLRKATIAADGTIGAPERLMKAGAEPNVRWYDLSPDGAWLAFTVQQPNNQTNVLLTRFPSGEGRWQVTNDGGTFPHFSPDGKQLFYASGTRDAQGRTVGRLMSVPILTTPSVTIGSATVVMQQEVGAPTGLRYSWFDVGPDGRFLVFRRTTTAPEDRQRLFVIQNWPALIEKQ